jgi:hypothetical protein
MVGFTVFSIISNIKRNKEFNWAFAALVGAWVGYIAQSIISINQLGLATYGWLLMGCIIGIEYKDKRNLDKSKEEFPSKKIRNKRKIKQKTLTGTGVTLAVLGLLTSAIVTLPLYLGDLNYRATAKAGNIDEHVKAATTFPVFSSRIVETANHLANAGRQEDAKTIVDKAITENERDYNAWFLKFQLAEPGSPEEASAENMLSYLNPKVQIKK